jgi:DNA repair protein RadA/Sms
VAPARASSEYVCQACAAGFPRWEGQCRSCGAWNTLVETRRRPSERRLNAGVAPRSPALAPRPLGEVGATAVVRRPTGLAEVDRLLGGGIVPGTVVLLGGEPGIGKSTLVLQMAAALAEQAAAGSGQATVLYASAEESAGQLHLRAQRLGLTGGTADGALQVLGGSDVGAIVTAAAAELPALLVVDSIQTVELDGLEGPPGSVGQVRESAAQLGAFARDHGVPVLLVGHVTKDGTLAGPRTLEHLVDVVLMLDGDRYGTLRLLRALKNRHGSTEEVGVMEMTTTGLHAVRDTATAFLGEGDRAAPGVAVAAVLEGTRPLLVEVQALVAPAGMGPPRRTVSGLDKNRLSLLVAVLARRGGIDVSNRDVYASLAGGLTATEPALDLPLALAIAASQRDQALPRDLLVCGELSLLGEVRPVSGLDRRLREAARLGFGRALVPARGDVAAAGLELVRAGTLREAIERGFATATGTSG